MFPENVQITLENDVPNLGRAGQRVTLDLVPADVRDASEMDDALFGYKPFTFRADEASPVVLRNNETDKYRTFNSDNAFLKVDVEGDADGNVKEVDPGSATAEYIAKAKFLGSYVPVSVEHAAHWDARMVAARRIKTALQLAREIEVWAMLTTSGNWNAAVRQTLSTNENWNGGTSSTPITDLQTMLKASNQPITDIFMNRTVVDALLSNTQTTTWLAAINGSDGYKELFSENNGKHTIKFPTMPPIHIVESKYRDTPNGALSDCLGNYVVGISKPPMSAGVPVSGEEIATSYTFRQKGLSGNGYQSREVARPLRGLEGGTMVIGGTKDVPKMTSNVAGGAIIGTVIA